MELNKINKPTIVIGASDNPERYSNKACLMLLKHNHTVYPYGLRTGKIAGLNIITHREAVTGADTITLYVGPKNQLEWLSFILACKPKRVIFNPGTENPSFQSEIEKNGIEVIEACTLVMLSIGNY